MDYLKDKIEDLMKNHSHEIRMRTDQLISAYLMKNNLTPSDLLIFGRAEHCINAHKIIYYYKNDIICEIDQNINVTIKNPFGPDTTFSTDL